MNKQDLDALRAKHRLVDYRDGADYPKCGYCNTGTWPCDVIRVLDWAETLVEVGTYIYGTITQFDPNYKGTIEQ